MSDQPLSESPIEELFEQSVVQGSARYWAAHFAGKQHRSRVKAALCFAHAMDMLTLASSEVIAEKSVWWHDELTNCTPSSARHPITRALLTHPTTSGPSNDADSDGHLDGDAPIIQALHQHLHGALMTQQSADIDSSDAWSQYAELRFGSLHEMIGLASGMSTTEASTLGQWAAQLHALGILRAPTHYDDPRLLEPPQNLLNENPAGLENTLLKITSNQPATAPANQVIISHELAWWKEPATEASPLFAGLPTGLRGMLTSWQAARKARSL